MRMSDLIEDVMVAMAERDDLVEWQGSSHSRSLWKDLERTDRELNALDKKRNDYNKSPEGKASQENKAKRVAAALKRADSNPKIRCPDGYTRGEDGRCRKKGMGDKIAASKQQKMTAHNNRSSSGAAKPSLVDRMKALFGKK